VRAARWAKRVPPPPQSLDQTTCARSASARRPQNPQRATSLGPFTRSLSVPESIPIKLNSIWVLFGDGQARRHRIRHFDLAPEPHGPIEIVPACQWSGVVGVRHTPAEPPRLGKGVAERPTRTAEGLGLPYALHEGPGIDPTVHTLWIHSFLRGLCRLRAGPCLWAGERRHPRDRPPFWPIGTSPPSRGTHCGGGVACPYCQANAPFGQRQGPHHGRRD
jgi:hypothetical protein